MQNCARIAFGLAKEMDGMGVVVDADGLWLVQVSPIPHTPTLYLETDWPERTKIGYGLAWCTSDSPHSQHNGIQEIM